MRILTFRKVLLDSWKTKRGRFEPFRDSRTLLDSMRDKLVTLIYFVFVQCPSVGTTWYSASYARKGYT